MSGKTDYSYQKAKVPCTCTGCRDLCGPKGQLIPTYTHRKHCEKDQMADIKGEGKCTHDATDGVPFEKTAKLDEVGCIDGAVVQEIPVDELCDVVLIQFHPFRHVHYRDGCHGGEGIIWGMYFMHHQQMSQSGCEI